MPPRFPTVFEALVNGVACQELSLGVGIQVLNRLAADRGKATSDSPDSSRAVPDPHDLASLEPADLKRHSFSSIKARTVIETARRSSPTISTWTHSHASRIARRSSA